MSNLATRLPFSASSNIMFTFQICFAHHYHSTLCLQDRSYVVSRFGRNMLSVLNDQLTEMILAKGKVFGMFLVE